MPDKLIARSVSLDDEGVRIFDKLYPLKPDQKVYIFGSGKASTGMAGNLLSVLGDKVAGGSIVTNQISDTDLSPLNVIEGTHPVPDEKSIKGADSLIQGLSNLDQDDFFFYLLSGGSSALVEKPLPGISLAEMQHTTGLLLANGVPIQAINAVRKHLSMVKGGRLSEYTQAKGVVLVISDVIGDDLSVIGSGPLYYDPDTFHDCREILQYADIWDKVHAPVRTVIESGEKGDIPETPKALRESIHHYLIGTNQIALEAAERTARQECLYSRILTSSLDGEAREVGMELVAMARNLRADNEALQFPACLLFGGETTVTVRGSGKGGRNQELVLAALEAMQAGDDMLILSGGTDGIDGNSTAAGAFCDNAMRREASEQGLLIENFLNDNNSNAFFRGAGGLIEIGSTGTNVMDIAMVIIDKEEI